MKKKDKKPSILKTKRIRIFLIITIVCIIAGVSFFVYPSVINYFSNVQQERILEEWESGGKSIDIQIVDYIHKSFEDIKNSSGQLSDSKVVPGEPENNKDNIGTEYDPEELDYSNLTAEDFFPAKITIPAIDLEWIVNEGTDTQTLRKGPGHIIETVLPGDLGRCAISGHRTTYGAPFNRIDEMQNGDLIHIETKEGLNFTYALTSKVVVSPQDVYVLDGAEKKELILTSCEPKYSAAKRLVVISELLNIYIF